MSMGWLDAALLVRGWMVWVIGLRDPAIPSADASSIGLGVRSSERPVARLAAALAIDGEEGRISGRVGTKGVDPWSEVPR